MAGIKREFYRLPRAYDPAMEREVELGIQNLKAHYAARIAYYHELYRTCDTEAVRDSIAYILEQEDEQG